MQKRDFLFIVMSALSMIAMAQISFEENGIVYMEDLSDPSKMAVIVMPKKSPLTQDKSLYSGNITIPSHIKHDLDNYEVVGISYGSFYSDKIESLKIEDGVQYIADYAIISPSLKKLIIPGSIKTLSWIKAENLEEVEIGDGVETINEINFGKVKTLRLPKSLYEIKGLSIGSDNRMYDSPEPLSLIHVEFENGIRTLTYCFTQFGGEVLTLPNTIETIDNSFVDCPNLKKLKINGDLESLRRSFKYMNDVEELNLPSIQTIESSFEECYNLKSLIIGEGTQQIIDSFKGVINLKSLKLPNSLVSVDESFTRGHGRWFGELETIHFGLGYSKINYFIDDSNNSLKEIYCPWKEIPNAPRFSYDYMKGIKQLKIYVPKGMSKDYQSAWGLENWEGILFVEHF